jgi:hypothetical protein
MEAGQLMILRSNSLQDQFSNITELLSFQVTQLLGIKDFSLMRSAASATLLSSIKT